MSNPCKHWLSTSRQYGNSSIFDAINDAYKKKTQENPKDIKTMAAVCLLTATQNNTQWGHCETEEAENGKHFRNVRLDCKARPSGTEKNEGKAECQVYKPYNPERNPVMVTFLDLNNTIGCRRTWRQKNPLLGNIWTCIQIQRLISGEQKWIICWYFVERSRRLCHKEQLAYIFRMKTIIYNLCVCAMPSYTL